MFRAPRLWNNLVHLEVCQGCTDALLADSRWDGWTAYRADLAPFLGTRSCDACSVIPKRGEARYVWKAQR